MPRRSLVVASAVIAAGAIAGPASAGLIGGDPSTYGSIAIAVEAPLSGSQASNGQDMLRSVQLAVNQYNAKGGYYGRKVVIVKADDKADPSIANKVAKKAISAGVVGVIGPYNSSVGVINLPTYIKAKVVPVQMTSVDATSGKGITLQPKNSQISPVEADFILNQWKPAKVSMLVDPSDYTKSMADRLEVALKDKGVLVTQIPISEDQTDFTPQITQALTNNPTVVYLSTYYPQGSAIAAQLKATGNPAKCFAGLANQDPAFVTQAGIPASQHCVFSGVPDPTQMPTAKSYVSAYKKAFPGKTPGTWGTFTYDSARLLFRAWGQANDPFSYGKVLAKLRKTTNWQGATGKVTINRAGNRPNVPVSILTVNSSGNFDVMYTNRKTK